MTEDEQYMMLALREAEMWSVAAQDVKKYDHYEFERIKVAEPLTIAFKRVK